MPSRSLFFGIGSSSTTSSNTRSRSHVRSRSRSLLPAKSVAETIIDYASDASSDISVSSSASQCSCRSGRSSRSSRSRSKSSKPRIYVDRAAGALVRARPGSKKAADLEDEDYGSDVTGSVCSGSVCSSSTCCNRDRKGGKKSRSKSSKSSSKTQYKIVATRPRAPKAKYIVDDYDELFRPRMLPSTELMMMRRGGGSVGMDGADGFCADPPLLVTIAPSSSRHGRRRSTAYIL